MAHDVHQSHAEVPVTVEMLLGEPLLRGRIIGGHAGLARAVTWCLPLAEVNAPAVPVDASAQDLDGVAIHLSSASLATADRARALVEGLARRGVSALLAWPGRTGEPVSLDAAARAADAASIPLLALGPGADFRRVSHLVAMKVLTQDAHVLEYSARVHRTLGEVFAHGSGLGAMARSMSHLSRTPVYILGLDGETLAYADVNVSTATVHSGAGASVVAELIDRHRQERAEVAGLTGEGMSHSRIVQLDLDGGQVHAVAAPVTVADDPYGVVLVVEPAWPADEHDLAQHRVIAEQGATLAGSEMLRQRSVSQAEERARDDFVGALLHGRFADQHELEARSRHYRFDTEGRFATFVVTASGLEADRRPDARQVAAAARAAAGVGARPDLLTLTAHLGSMIVVVRQLPVPAARQHGEALAERESLQAFADQLHRAMRDRLGDEVRIAYGRGGTGAVGVARSYREARTAVALAEKANASSVCGYDDLRVFAAIQEVAASSAGQAFAKEVLGPLRKADGQTGDLEGIVIAYIEESGNLNATARRLRLHRNTMLYKLDRASRALQMDVRVSETQFMVWLAHHIDTLSRVHTALDDELTSPTAAIGG